MTIEFEKWEIDKLDQYEVPIEIAGSYPRMSERYNIFDTIYLYKKNVFPEDVARWNVRFDLGDLRTLVEKGVTPEIADSYPKSMDPYNIGKCHEHNVPPDIAEKYFDIFREIFEDE